jgi:transcriptional regulator with XRE-family HTH domain
MLDLQTLGSELRRRRRALRIKSAELARRIGVSPTYIWLIETAKPRERGEPSRPSEDLLTRWTAALGMDEGETQRMRALAGYFDPEPSAPPRPPGTVSPTMLRPASPPAMMPSPQFMLPAQPSPSSAEPGAFVPDTAALQQWAERTQEEAPDQVVQRTQEILGAAAQHGRQEEATSLIASFLDWLDFHLHKPRG